MTKPSLSGVSESEAAFERPPGDEHDKAHLDAVWTPEAVAAVERAEAELANGGGVPHAEVVRRTRAILGR